MLNLPRYEDLDREQDDVLNLPLDDSHLVAGPPGSGKSVMAIYRAKALSEAGESVKLLMFNKLLATYTSAAVKKLKIEGSATTYHAWFPTFFKQQYGQDPPKVDDWLFDWRACWDIIMKVGPPKKGLSHIIVDEGQDMPKDFYGVVSLVGKTVTVFADENQQLTERHSTLSEIQRALGLKRFHLLKRNHRNTRRIAEVAATFYTGLPSGIADLPSKANLGELPELVHDGHINDSVQYVVNIAKLHPKWTIGVLVPYTNQQVKFYNRLADKVKVPVSIHAADRKIMAGRTPVDFTKPGIRVVNHMSAKGLEFDAVILPELQDWNVDHSGVEFKRRMYVMASRARTQLSFRYTGAGEPALISALPKELIDIG